MGDLNKFLGGIFFNRDSQFQPLTDNVLQTHPLMNGHV